MTEHSLWLAVGFLGQALFSARFFLQWIASERRRKSILPNAFWYFSILGGMTLLSYAIYQRDAVFIVGQASGLLIYIRNLVLVKRHQDSLAEDTV